MKCLLFRKLVINDINYYQLYKIDENFEPSDDFKDFSERDKADYFYVNCENVKNIDDCSLNSLFFDQDGELLKLREGNLYNIIQEEFTATFNNDDILIDDKLLSQDEIEKIREIVLGASNTIMFQEENMIDMLRQIYHNQKVLDFDYKLKTNILFSGPRGNGKRTFVKYLKDHLNIPYAEITELHDNQTMVNNICEQLSTFENKNGIVFINCGLSDLRSRVESDEDVPSDGRIRRLTESGKVLYDGKEFDFDCLTFIIIYDEFMYRISDGDEIINTCLNLNCKYHASFDDLSNDAKLKILLSDNSKLALYSKILREHGQKLIAYNDSLKKLISVSSKVLSGVDYLNNFLEIMMRDCIQDGFHDLIIDNKKVNELLKENALLDLASEPKKKHSEPQNDEFNKVLPEVLKVVIGQDEHIKRILYTIMENKRMANNPELRDPKKYIDNILIRGESGGGKTLIIDTISKLLDIPCYTADATKYTEAGYQGGNVEDMLISLYHKAGDDLEKAQKGILIIDEIDKKANNNSENDVSRGAVLDGLLKLVEGTTLSLDTNSRMDLPINSFDTSRLTVICSGAFVGIEKIRDARIKKLKGNTIGFNNSKENTTIDENVIDEDFVNYGMTMEFMGRLPIIINLNKNTENSLKNIMINSSVSALKIQKFKFETKGIAVSYTDDFYEALAKKAFQLKIGARGIAKAFQTLLTNIGIENIDSANVSQIIFDKEVVDDPSKIILVPREKSKIKKIGSKK